MLTKISEHEMSNLHSLNESLRDAAAGSEEIAYSRSVLQSLERRKA
jgi:hypothetical protein